MAQEPPLILESLALDRLALDVPEDARIRPGPTPDRIRYLNWRDCE